MKKGFTLVEVSIAVVVVSILIAGIVMGKGLFDTARIKKLSSTAEELSVAFNAFKLQYDCMPGDCGDITDYFGAETIDGNDDKEITAFEDDGDIIFENFLLFEHLGLAELSSSFSRDPNCYFNPNTSNVVDLFLNCNYPIPAFNAAAFIYSYGTFPANVTPYSPFVCINTSAGCLTTEEESNMSSEQALQLDSTYDDGRPLTGKIISACTSEIDSFVDFETADKTLEYDLSLDSCPIILKL